MSTELFTESGVMLPLTIREIDYPVQVSGDGRPVLTIGPGSAMHRTLSEDFRKAFKLYALDLYWIEHNSQPNPYDLTLTIILEDIKASIEQLNLVKPLLWGHSAFGILALEFAKQYPELCSGVIMIGSPLNCNQDVDTANKKYFHENASAQRKALYAQRSKEVSELNLNNSSLAERFKIEYIYRDAPRYWAQMDFDCSEIWDDLLPPPEFAPLFNEILPSIEVRDFLDKLICPVYIAAGMYDYDCCPWHWESIAEFAPLITVERYQSSGHYPHYEEQECFDHRISHWIAQQG